MGIQKFYFFINNYCSNLIDEITITDNNKKYLVTDVLFDINFIIYKAILEVDKDANDILKLLYALEKYTSDKEIVDILLNNITSITNKKYWNSIIVDTIDPEKYIEIVNSNIDNLLKECIIYLLNKSINEIHYIEYIENIIVCFDGTPSLSKIIEQRKRRIRNQLEYTVKDSIIENINNSIRLNNVKLYNTIENKHLKDNKYNYITYNYQRWIDTKIKVEKKIYPRAPFILSIEKYISDNLKYGKINIVIDGSDINGESDVKIFQYISNNIKEDSIYCIHTTDSDLIHSSLIQENYYRDYKVNYHICKYIKNYSIDDVQYIKSSEIINFITNSYINTNCYISKDSNIVNDILFIFYLFGNDHLPSSLEIGPELNLDFYINAHVNSIYDNYIVTIVGKDEVSINLKNLSNILKYIDNNRNLNITKIILHKFFKLNVQLINLFVYIFNYSFYDILEFVKKVIIFNTLKMTDEEINNLDSDDIRKSYIKNITDKDKWNTIDVFNLSPFNQKHLLSNMDLICNSLNYYDGQYNGLMVFNKSITITQNSYNDLIAYDFNNELIKLKQKYPDYYEQSELEDYLNILKNTEGYDKNIVENYMKKLLQIGYTNFTNMKNYHTDNITYYRYIKCPTVKNIIKYIEEENIDLQKWKIQFETENITEYYTGEEHYEIINPFNDPNFDIADYRNI